MTPRCWQDVMELWPLPTSTRGGTSGYRGVHRRHRKWVASAGGQRLGAFDSEREAALACEEFAVRMGTSRKPSVDEAAGLARIPLTMHRTAVVDLDDLPIVAPYIWCVSHAKNDLYYAVTGKPKQIRMHRLLMPEVPSSLLVDHRNGDGLDNRRCNLRPATEPQNKRNRGATKGSSSGYVGVSRSANGLWSAAIRIGSFATEEDAARAYDEIAKLVDPEFARLNFPEVA